MVRVAIAFGSNKGDRVGQIRIAIMHLGKVLDDLHVSPMYETDPMYVEDQPAFVNGALLGWTSVGPIALLAALKAAERYAGRMPGEPNGPREIDLDLIAYGRLQLRSAGKLSLPHPRLHERRFVLQPLFDLDPSLDIPGLGRVDALLAATDSQRPSVRRMNDAGLSVPIY